MRCRCVDQLKWQRLGTTEAISLLVAPFTASFPKQRLMTTVRSMNLRKPLKENCLIAQKLINFCFLQKLIIGIIGPPVQS